MAQDTSTTKLSQEAQRARALFGRRLPRAPWWALACALAGLCTAVPAPAYLYLLQPPLWLAAAGLAYAHWRSRRMAAPGDRRLLLTCAQAGLLHIALYALAGVLSGFRVSPRPIGLDSILLNIGLASVQLVGIEAARWCLVCIVGQRRVLLTLAVAWLLPWLAHSLPSLAGRPGVHPAHFVLTHHLWLPELSEHLLAACMALVGGPLASLVYRSILMAPKWLSPVVPNLNLATSACLAVSGPALGWLAVANHIRQLRLNRRLEHMIAERTRELVQANARLRAISRHLVEMQEGERRRIARELHDEGGQALTTLLVGLRLLEREAGDAAAVRRRVAQLCQAVDRTSETLHRLASDLRPASLDQLGLVPALQQHVYDFGAHHSLQVQFAAVGLQQRLAPTLESAIFRIVQEALTNVARHAGASRADVLLQRHNGRLVVIIEDDGAGFDPQRIAAGSHMGLLGMQERVEMLGGTLTVESAPGAGTTIAAEVPCGHTHPDR